MSTQGNNQTFIIVGAGHGAGQAVTSLRTKGFEGRIVLIGEEPYIPYQRPPLSKAYLAGDLTLERLYFKPAKFYDDRQVDVLPQHPGDQDQSAGQIRHAAYR